MASHYVDFTLGDDGNDGLSVGAPWKTIAEVNAASFSAGDSVLFKKGETWREQLTVPSSGSVGSPVTAGAYGTGDLPKIYGSDAAGAWTDEGSNIWYCACTALPVAVWFIAPTTGVVTWGKKETTKGAVGAEYDWWFDDPNDRLYVYAASDPGTRYASVEIPKRNICINGPAQDYVTVEYIDCAFSALFGVVIYNYGDNWTVSYNHIHHVGARDDATNGDCIRIARGNHCLISHNIINDGGRHSILLISDAGYTVDDNIIEYNVFYNSHHTVGPDIQSWSGTTHRNIVRYNEIYTTAAWASVTTTAQSMFIYGSADDTCEDNEVYYNKFHHILGNLNIGTYAVGTKVLNNVFYGVGAALSGAVSAIACGDTGSTGTIIKNNIGMDINGGNAADHILTIVDINGVAECDYNCWYQSAGGTVIYTKMYDGSWHYYHYDDFAAWQAATGWDTHGFWEDPKMVDPANGDYHLQAASPCIDTGVGVGLTEDYVGNPIH